MAASDSVVHLGEQGVRLSAGDLEAIVIPSAGMVVASLRSRGDELLGRADALAGWVDGGAHDGHPAPASVGEPDRRHQLRGR